MRENRTPTSSHNLSVPIPDIDIARLDVCVCTRLTGKKFVDFISFPLQPANH